MKSRLNLAWICACIIAVSASRADTSLHPSETMGTVRQMYDGHLLPDVAVTTFSHIDRLFLTRVVHHWSNVYPLPTAARPLANFTFRSRNKQWDLYDYLAVNRVAGLLVLKDGKIAFETYQLGTTRETRWMSMSVAKSTTAIIESRSRLHAAFL